MSQRRQHESPDQCTERLQCKAATQHELDLQNFLTETALIRGQNLECHSIYILTQHQCKVIEQ